MCPLFQCNEPVTSLFSLPEEVFLYLCQNFLDASSVFCLHLTCTGFLKANSALQVAHFLLVANSCTVLCKRCHQKFCIHRMCFSDFVARGDLFLSKCSFYCHQCCTGQVEFFLFNSQRVSFFHTTQLSIGGQVDLLEVYAPSGKLQCITAEEIAIWAAKSNKANVLSWLKEKGWNITNAEATFDTASIAGSLDALQWLDSVCDKEKLPTLRFYCFRTAVIHGHLDIVKWMWEPLVKDPMIDIFTVDMISLACSSKKLEVCDHFSFLFFFIFCFP